MIQKQLSEIAEILTINLFNCAIQLKHRHTRVAIDFIPWRMARQVRATLIPHKFIFGLEKSKREFAKVKAVYGP